LFRSPWRDASAAEITAREAAGEPHVIRLKAPREGQVTVEDAVQGTVTWEAAQLDDLILLRSDGTPVYMLAVVVDDHDMGVTHVIRGDDHLTNAARQSLIYRAMGWDVPVFAHIPLIHGPDGAKLSKRHGALGVEAYHEMGYVPEGMRNYLARLGWSHGDDEFFTTEQLTEWFGLESIGKAAARFDFAKLASINGQHIRMMANDRLEVLLHDFCALRQIDLNEAHSAMLTSALPGLKERAKTLAELFDLAYYILADRPLEPDEKAKKALSEEASQLLTRLTPHLHAATPWKPGPLEEAVRIFAENEGVKLGKVAQPLRAALTGRAVSPGVFDVMVTLGRDETLARIADITG
ncbi:MAG: glutamate--tRNA ligase, partial [Pseudomonadota bacterium]